MIYCPDLTFLFGCSHYVLIVANIRFQCELVPVLNWPACNNKNKNKDVTRSTLSYGSKHGGHWSQRLGFNLVDKDKDEEASEFLEEMILRMRMRRKRATFLIMDFAMPSTSVQRCVWMRSLNQEWWDLFQWMASLKQILSKISVMSRATFNCQHLSTDYLHHSCLPCLYSQSDSRQRRIVTNVDLEWCKSRMNSDMTVQTEVCSDWGRIAKKTDLYLFISVSVSSDESGPNQNWKDQIPYDLRCSHCYEKNWS